jgi:hypothetical protein
MALLLLGWFGPFSKELLRLQDTKNEPPQLDFHITASMWDLTKLKARLGTLPPVFNERGGHRI